MGKSELDQYPGLLCCVLGWGKSFYSQSASFHLLLGTGESSTSIHLYWWAEIGTITKYSGMRGEGIQFGKWYSLYWHQCTIRRIWTDACLPLFLIFVQVSKAQVAETQIDGKQYHTETLQLSHSFLIFSEGPLHYG